MIKINKNEMEKEILKRKYKKKVFKTRDGAGDICKLCEVGRV